MFSSLKLKLGFSIHYFVIFCVNNKNKLKTNLCDILITGRSVEISRQHLKCSDLLTVTTNNFNQDSRDNVMASSNYEIPSW
jgi:hypothetical protein